MAHQTPTAKRIPPISSFDPLLEKSSFSFVSDSILNPFNGHGQVSFFTDQSEHRPISLKIEIERPCHSFLGSNYLIPVNICRIQKKFYSTRKMDLDH